MGLKSWVVKKMALRWLRGKVKESKMGKAKKAWAAASGWKTFAAYVGYLCVLVHDQLVNGHAADFAGSVLVVLGVDVMGEGIDWPKATVTAVGALGIAHRLWKAFGQWRAGSGFAELLDTAGYIRARPR